eukprot:SAG31_NODE_47_length_30979_cov_41.708841_6_plen_492_part_00
MDRPGIDNLRNATIPKDPTKPGAGSYTFKCQKEYVCTEGPMYDPLREFDGNSSSELDSDDSDTVIDVFGPDQIPVKVKVSEEFAFFNRLYSSVPAASSPNHLFAQTGTSCGIVGNIPYSSCGGSHGGFPPLSIYDSLTLHNVSFGIYYNSTCGLGQNGSCYGPKSPEPTRGGVVSQYYGPDINIDSVWRYRKKFESHEKFYEAAAAGTLPSFSWISPSQQASDHPCNDIRKGERQLKDIYEAIRAGPKWKKTLMLVVYDDYGGAYDHVIPPAEWRTMDHMGNQRKGQRVPADDAPCHLLDKCGPSQPYWNFTSLGLRVTSMLISPWVEKGAVIQEPKHGPTNSSQFELSSIPATIHNLFNLSLFLTKRDEWAGTFDELLLDAPRDDCPMHLPDAPKPGKPWTPPPPLVELDDADGQENEPVPQHCGREDGVCRGRARESVQQRRRMQWLSLRTGVAAPTEEMTHDAAHEWLSQRWAQWVQDESEDKIDDGM